MQIFLTLAFLFFLGSTFGWVLELLFRRFVSAKRWLNPGFLTGPYLPLYGFGLCLLYLLSIVNLSFLPGKPLQLTVLILMMGIAMTLIEYIAGKIFIIGMHVKLWDYSGKWGNLEGIICPEFSFYWTVLGAAYYFLLHPRITGAVNWLFENLAFSFIIGFFFGIFVIDFSCSVSLMTRIRKFAKENHIIVRMEELKKNIAERAEKSHFVQFVFAFRSAGIPFAEHLRDYGERLRQYAGQITQKKHRGGRE